MESFSFFGLPLSSTIEMTLHIWIWVPRFPCIIYKYIHCSFTSQDAVPADLTGSLLNAEENTLNQQNIRANWTWTKRKSLSVSSGACQSAKCWWCTSNANAGKGYHAQCSRRGTLDQGWRDAGMQGARGSGDAWPKCVDKFLDLQWRQKAPRESLVLVESAGKLLTQINE